MSNDGPLIRRLQIARNTIIVGIILGASYIGYRAYEKHDKKHENRQIQEGFEKTLDFVVLKTNYMIKQDSLDKIHNNQNQVYENQSNILKDTYLAKKDSLMEVYKKNSKK